jgi:hypothetical protein
MYSTRVCGRCEATTYLYKCEEGRVKRCMYCVVGVLYAAKSIPSSVLEYVLATRSSYSSTSYLATTSCLVLVLQFSAVGCDTYVLKPEIWDLRSEMNLQYSCTRTNYSSVYNMLVQHPEPLRLVNWLLPPAQLVIGIWFSIYPRICWMF